MTRPIQYTTPQSPDQCIGVDDDVHVVPIAGREHELSIGCWCHPERDPEVPELIVHNLDN